MMAELRFGSEKVRLSCKDVGCASRGTAERTGRPSVGSLC